MKFTFDYNEDGNITNEHQRKHTFKTEQTTRWTKINTERI